MLYGILVGAGTLMVKGRQLGTPRKRPSLWAAWHSTGRPGQPLPRLLERAASKAADSTASADSTAFHHPGILMDLTYLVGGAAVSWLAVGFAIVQLGLKLAVRP